MLLNGWAIALTICSLGMLFTAGLAAGNGVRVLRCWDHGSDSALQIQLENQVWLTSALMQYGLVFQLFSLVLLVLAADSFALQLIGAMCATGAFTANEYGLVSLGLKIVSVLFSAYWLVLHRLDMCSELYPLVRIKYRYLLFLMPLLVADGIIQTMYIYQLEPDVLTSCCGVVFQPGRADGFNLLEPYSAPLVLTMLYLLATLLFAGGFWMYQLMARREWPGLLVVCLFALGWWLFLIVALWAITVVFSSYIYAMPFHRCPFDILKAEYSGQGVVIYLALFTAVFAGSSCLPVQLVRHCGDLSTVVRRYHLVAIPCSLLALLLFLLVTAYSPLRYILAGGEV